jgi:hypothetical protein
MPPPACSLSRHSPRTLPTPENNMITTQPVRSTRCVGPHAETKMVAQLPSGKALSVLSWQVQLELEERFARWITGR